MIEIEDLDVSYDGIRTILHKISLETEKGAFFGIIGPNGSGKTTLLKAISRVLSPQNGIIYIGGEDLALLPPRQLARTIGVVSQETSVSFDFSARDIVLMGRHPYIERFSSEQREDLEIVTRVMKQTNTAQFAERSINELSGGERQRVIIARALAQQPRVLLLDEPTSHLDINHQMEILSIIKNLKGEVTVVAVFHDLNLASYYCDQLILMNEGEIFSIGTPAGVLTKENLKAIFHVNAMVKINPVTQKPYIIPLFEENREERGSLRIHIICGGGSGTELMYHLHSAGYMLTVGVLCVNDSDFETATELNIPCIGEPPFSRISDDSLQVLKRTLDLSDVIILTEMPFGSGNIDNIRILKNYAEKNLILFMRMGRTPEIQDFTGGESQHIMEELLANGARQVCRVTELAGILHHPD